MKLLKNRKFFTLWIGQVISVFGDFVFTTTLVLWIATTIAKGQSWSPLAVSAIFFASALPILSVGPIAGVFADRWKKRPTMMRMDLLRTIIIASLIGSGLLLQQFLPHQSVFPLLLYLYLIVVLESVCAQFFNPSRLAFIGEIVPEEDHAQAMGMMQTTTNMAIIFGPPIGTFLFFALGASWSILTDALSFAISFLCILAIRVNETSRQTTSSKQGNAFWHEFRAGLNYYTHNKVLMILLITGIIFMSGGSALNALYIFFVTNNLHLPDAFYSALGSASGIGAVVGAALASILAKRVNLSKMLSFSLLGWGVLVLVFARLTTFAPALVIFFLLGGLNAGVNIAVGPLLLKNTPKDLVGRVVSVLTPAVTTASMLATIVAGTLASTVLKGLNIHVLSVQFGPIDTIFTATGLLAVLGGIYALLSFNHIERETPTGQAGPVKEITSRS